MCDKRGDHRADCGPKCTPRYSASVVGDTTSTSVAMLFETSFAPLAKDTQKPITNTSTRISNIWAISPVNPRELMLNL